MAAGQRAEALKTLLRWSPGFDETRLLTELRTVTRSMEMGKRDVPSAERAACERRLAEYQKDLERLGAETRRVRRAATAKQGRQELLGGGGGGYEMSDEARRRVPGPHVARGHPGPLGTQSLHEGVEGASGPRRVRVRDHKRRGAEEEMLPQPGEGREAENADSGPLDVP